MSTTATSGCCRASASTRVRGFRPFIRVASWAGTTTTFVEILGRTPKRLRIRFLSDCPKGKRGDVKLVPIDVVQWPEVPRE